MDDMVKIIEYYYGRHKTLDLFNRLKFTIDSVNCKLEHKFD